MPDISTTITDKHGTFVHQNVEHYKKDPTLKKRKRRRRSPRNLQILPVTQDEEVMERGPESIGGYDVLSGETAASTIGDVDDPGLTTHSDVGRRPRPQPHNDFSKISTLAKPPEPAGPAPYEYNRFNLGTLQRRKKREMGREGEADALSELDPQKLRMLKQLLIAITQGGK